MLTYEDLLNIGQAPDAEALQALLIDAAAKMDFGLSSGALIRGRLASRRASVHSFGNPPAGFVEASKSVDLGLKDPLLTGLLARPGVLAYDSAFYVNEGAADLAELLDAFGYRHGIAVSMHETSHAEAFFFGLDGPDALPSTLAARFELEANLRLIALHAHEAAKRLWTPRPAVELGAVTEQEVEALRWAMDGVSVWHTRGKTVYSNPGRAHAQRSAAQKLGARTAAGAVLRAIEGGLIDP